MVPRFQNLDKLHLPPIPTDARSHLVRALTALVEQYGAERIVAFGSCVHGDVTEHSDVDLCVVREHPPGCTHPHLEALAAVSRSRPLISTDVLVRSLRQWEESRRQPFGVMEEVMRRGIVLYEK